MEWFMRETLAQLINELAEALVFLDPGDLAGCGQLLNILDRFGEEELADEVARLKDPLDMLRAIVIEIIYNEFSQPKKDLEALNRAFSCLQEAFHGGTGAASHTLTASAADAEDERQGIAAALVDTTSREAKHSLSPEAGEQETVPTGERAVPAGDISAADNSGDRAAAPPPADSPAPEPQFSGPMFAGVDLSVDQDLFAGFIAESNEHLDTIETNILNLEQDPGNTEIINSIFRPFHTIKGVAGFMNLKEINVIAHQLENLLDDARNAKIRLNSTATDLILDGVDLLKAMLDQLRQALGGKAPEPLPVDDFLARIDAVHRMLLDQSEAKQVDRGISEGVRVRRLGEILVTEKSISEADLENILSRQQADMAAGKPTPRLGELLLKEKKVKSKTLVNALRQQSTMQGQQQAATIKVNLEKLDNLVDMVGELVIVQAMISQDPDILGLTGRKITQNLGQLGRITSSLQNIAMSLRMVEIRQTFNKMVRLVRDLAKKSGKQVELEMYGEDTEIDKNMVDLLYDPLVHMIRNSVDHGIELPEAREKAGKPAGGTIQLKAYHRGGNIVIEIIDDGKGLDAARIRRKAVERGLITDNAQMSEKDIFNLVMLPGLSTADEITEVSGRGVGMDVVKRAIEEVRGSIDLDSEPGKGTVVTITVPLTLAIIDGMVVTVGKERFIIPTINVVESLRPTKEQCHTVQNQGEIIKVRDRLLPLIRLDHFFEFPTAAGNPWERLVVVVENEGEQRCLLVDELVGKQEIVIKSLGECLKHIRGIAGGAIMGDGRVGLILDVAGIISR
jgi:two-component system chemotaxis sensor kinase CheA